MQLLPKSLLHSLALPLALPLGLLLCAQPAAAQTTAISQSPLQTISDTGAVKPNLMLLYDNSGSMNYIYTPDYIANSVTCRSRATLAEGTRGCTIGDPAFASADFNRQYYDPKVRYSPPIKADGTSYPDMNRNATSGWTAVPTDYYGVNETDMLGNRADTTNLVSGFPDIAWCDSNNNNCVLNTTGYVYPNNSRYRVRYVNSAPYYYSINVAEYCTDNTMTNCVATAVNGDPPAGYTVPAKVRFCNSSRLTDCQAKYVDKYVYPRFSGENRNAPWWGTITIGASSGTGKLTIDSVSAAGLSGTEVITNGPVSAATGTDTEDKRSLLATALAASIIDKSGLANQFTACVRTPRQTSVPSCSTFGITLDATNVVAVIPLLCPEGASGKGACTAATDNSRAGDNLMVTSGAASTALLRISGTSNANNNQILESLSLGNTALLPRSLTLSKGIAASAIAAEIVKAVGTRGSVTAYVGGNAITPLCKEQVSSTVCLVDTGANAEGGSVTVGNLTNNTVNKTQRISYSVSSAASTRVPTSTTGLGASIFVRTSIESTRTAYPRDPARTDCQRETCSYDEEMTNFANWYAYYKSRNQMMKTAVGQAFGPVTDKYNVGVVALSVAAAQGTINRPVPFSGTNRTNWYSSLYGMTTSGSTPVRMALHSIGKMYANQSPYKAAKGKEAIEYACQQNFTFITTDGYWNGDAPSGVDSNDEREDPARFCLGSKGCVDSRNQSVPSLADISLYWYNGGSNGTGGSLRPDLEDLTKPGQVPAASGENRRLHMKTYALGLGVDGIMTYEQDYDTAASQNGDFYKVITGVTSGCPWNGGGAWTWPNPESEKNSGSLALQARVDDLWHAAINGHGKYFSASDPQQVIEGLRKALSAIEIQIGAGAAAATSTPNVTALDNDVFSSTYTSVVWSGRLAKRKMNVNTGEVEAAEAWNTSSTLGTRVDAAEDSRRILMRAAGSTDGALVDFLFKNFTTTVERNWFAGKCSALAQCANMSQENRLLADSGENMVNWLRGQQQHADNAVLRSYPLVGTVPEILGDIVSSKPAYLLGARKSYPEADYKDFAASDKVQNRSGTVFVGANDGMLHAFNAASGNELWAYVPRITMKKLHRRASTAYGENHQYTVDGSPELADVKIVKAGKEQWATVLVGGLNAGGRGFYALDVTDPNNPRSLWELCADAAACDNVEAEMGYSFGNPQFGTIKIGGKETWVVFLTSGYNNVPGTDGVDGGTGTGWLFVVDITTGKVLQRVSTGVGSVGTPSGLAKISAITSDPALDAKVTDVYGGDNTGKMWRFDFNDTQPKLILMGDAGVNQPITTRPEVTTCLIDEDVLRLVDGKKVPKVKPNGRIVVFGTGRLLDLSDMANPGVQSLYVLRDKETPNPITAAEWRKGAMLQKSLAREQPGNADSPLVMSGNALNWEKHKGWYVDLTTSSGERVNLDPKVVAGTLVAVTNIPSASTSCSVGGTSNLYQFNVCLASNGVVGEVLSGSAAVGSTVVRLPNGEFKAVISDAKGNLVTREVKPSVGSAPRRIGWRRVRE